MTPLVQFLYIFFGICLLAFSGMFIYGRLVFQRGEEERGMQFTFFSLLAMVLTFFAVLGLYLYPIMFKQKTVVHEYSEIPGILEMDFPPPPPLPSFFVEEYSFKGFWNLSEKEIIPAMTVYVLFCPKDKDYDIIYAGFSKEEEIIYKHKQFDCWINACDRKDIYLSFFSIPKEKNAEHGEAIKQDLNKKRQPICQEEI